MTPEQLKARQLGGGQGAAAAAAAAGPAKIPEMLRDLLAAQAAERESMEIDHHNAKLELREAHIEAVQALNAKLKAMAEANAKLAAAAPATKGEGK